MKILIIIDSLGAGGAETSTEVLCDFLVQKNVHLKILVLDEVEVGVQDRMIKNNYDITFIKKGSFINEVRQISEIIKMGNYDLVHSILFRSNLRTRFAKTITRFVHLESLVNTTYSSERELDERVNKSALKFYKLLDKLSARQGVDHFHSITETVKLHYIEELSLNPSLITVVPRGRKPIISKFKDRSRSYEDKVKIINVGRHEFQKGQIFLLEAVKSLKEDGYNFSLQIFGRDGAVTSELKEYIRKNDLENHVFLCGYTDRIPEQLLKADIFAFTSLYEGLGGALIEAQAAGLPVACNNIPVLHEVVIENQNAKFFNVHETASIVEALKFFIENPEERIMFGERSLMNYQNKFQEIINNQSMMELYEKLVKKREVEVLV